jgi:hypothetical protein
MARCRIAIDPQTVVALRDWRELQLEDRLRWVAPEKTVGWCSRVNMAQPASGSVQRSPCSVSLNRACSFKLNSSMARFGPMWSAGFFERTVLRSGTAGSLTATGLPLVGPEGIEPSTLGLKVSSGRYRGVSPDDEKCLLTKVSGVAGYGPTRLVSMDARVNVVRMWSGHQPALASAAGGSRRYAASTVPRFRHRA